MKNIFMIFIIICGGLIFGRSLFNLGKALNGDHKIGDKICIKHIVIASIAAVVMLFGIAELMLSAGSFISSLF